VPGWLAEYKQGDGIDVAVFLGSDVVFCPGGEIGSLPIDLDEHPGSCWVYVDHGDSGGKVRGQLESPNSTSGIFAGYKTLDRVDLEVADLTPDGWDIHLSMREQLQSIQGIPLSVYAFVAIWEREEVPAEHDGKQPGPDRFAILVIGGDVVATYDALFGQKNSPALWAVFLANHGCDVNSTKLVRGGLLEKVAQRTGKWPKFLIVDKSALSWEDYEIVPEITQTSNKFSFYKKVYLENRKAKSLAEAVQLSLGQLSDYMNLPKRRIRYLIDEGLVDSPDGKTRAASYNERHIARLQIVKEQIESGKKMAEISKDANFYPMVPKLPERLIIQSAKIVTVIEGVRIMIDESVDVSNGKLVRISAFIADILDE